MNLIKTQELKILNQELKILNRLFEESKQVLTKDAICNLIRLELKKLEEKAFYNNLNGLI